VRPRSSLVACGALTAALLLDAGAGVAGGRTSSAGPYRNGLVAFVRCCGPTGLFVVRPDGGGARRIYTPRGDDAPLDPAWSPNGRQIAYVPGGTRDGLWVMGSSGGKRRRVVTGRGDALFPSWSPDGSKIVFADLGSTRSGFHDLYVVRTNGSGLARLTRARADELDAAWAPTGGAIVYDRGRDLWRMRPDGSEQRLLARNASSPSWSPGGTHIAFVRDGDPWVMSRDGTAAKRIVHMTRRQLSLAWSPDGRWVATAPVDRGELVLVRTDGSEVRALTHEPGYGHSWPSWQRLPG
jgi:Tol biopolymer transport system component